MIEIPKEVQIGIYYFFGGGFFCLFSIFSHQLVMAWIEKSRYKAMQKHLPERKPPTKPLCGNRFQDQPGTRLPEMDERR